MVRHKVLKYRILTPDFAIGRDLVPAMLRYEPKKMWCIGGYISYGELDLMEIPPETYERHLKYVGWRDATETEEYEIKWRRISIRKALKEDK